MAYSGKSRFEKPEFGRIRPNNEFGSVRGSGTFFGKKKFKYELKKNILKTNLSSDIAMPEVFKFIFDKSTILFFW